ncbi:MAG: Respiratory supercomplex factor 1, mitochondrial [Stictis urceolatum]|nr:Respiratory supercomplex factor 1, mitochondrial [Stictis urceolata]
MSSRLPSSFDQDSDFYIESRTQKVLRRLREEPLVPFGCALTCYALYRASSSMRTADHNQTNRMFRARIYAQAFTLVAIYVGSQYYAEDRKKRKEVEGIVSEKKAAEKRDAWIRELEHRDREEREEREERDRVRGERARMVAKEDGKAKMVLEERERRIGVLDAVRSLGWR